MGKRKKIKLEQQLVTAYAADGKCIIRHENKVIFVTGAVPGDVVDVFLIKNKKDWAEAIVTQFHEFSKDRIEPFCAHFGVCGGCKWQMLPYIKQTEYKQQQVQDQLTRIGKVTTAEYLPIKVCAQDRLYRNKLQFTFSNKRYLTNAELNDMSVKPDANVVGYHAPQLFDKVIDINTCYLQEEPANKLRNSLREFSHQHELSFYDLREHKGLMRLITIRTTTLGHTLVNMMFGENNPEQVELVMQFIATNFPEVNSLYYTINTKLNDSAYDLTPVLYKGQAQIQEQLGKYIFNISPHSFFQTNTNQAVELYSIAKNFAGLTGKEILYDLLV
jgi:23S rRNA (uracil1939-C5)-methyltransferase